MPTWASSADVGPASINSTRPQARPRGAYVTMRFGLPFDSRLTLGGVPGASCALIDRGGRATYATGEEPAKGNARNDPPAWIGGQDGGLERHVSSARGSNWATR